MDVALTVLLFIILTAGMVGFKELQFRRANRERLMRFDLFVSQFGKITAGELDQSLKMD